MIKHQFPVPVIGRVVQVHGIGAGEYGQHGGQLYPAHLDQETVSGFFQPDDARQFGVCRIAIDKMHLKYAVAGFGVARYDNGVRYGPDFVVFSHILFSLDFGYLVLLYRITKKANKTPSPKDAI